MDLAYLAGIAGLIIVLVAFVMEQTGRWQEDDLLYDGANFLGSLLLVIYAILGNAVPFIVLNVVWGGYSLYDVILDLRKEYAKKHHLLKSKRAKV